MTDILTEEEIGKIASRNELCMKFYSDDSVLTEAESDREALLKHVSYLQAQNKRLVEALDEISEFVEQATSLDYAKIRVHEAVLVALSTLPAEALEAERRREEVIGRFQEVVNKHAVTAESIRDEQDTGDYSSVEWWDLLPTLEALEGGK